MTHFSNAYTDPRRAEAYASLGFPATYTLAFRDLPGLLGTHVSGVRALDFGCGAGRSTRFLGELGFDVTGADISREMLRKARELDAGGRYVLTGDDPGSLPAGPFDLVLAAYPFDNIPGATRRVALLTALRQRLGPAGRLVLLASSPELYVHEWATFTTAAFPENAAAGSGERVRIVIKKGGDPRPIDDLRWFDNDYRASFRDSGLDVLAVHRPLATGDEPYEWISETEIPPWVLYVTAAMAG